MAPASVPALVLASITFYVAVFNLVVYLRMPRHREYLTFSLACLGMGLYDFFCAGLYSASEQFQGAAWQRLQGVALALVSVFFPWFVVHYLSAGMPLSRRWRMPLVGFTVFSVANALLPLVERSGLYWTGEPATKVIPLPGGATVTYYEVVPGPLSNVQSAVGLLVFLYVLAIVIVAFRRGLRKETTSLLIALGLFFCSALHDTAMSTGLYLSVYTMEYTYMGMVLLMTGSLMAKVVEAASVREALRASEARFRSLVEATSDWIWETDADMHFTYSSPKVHDILGYWPEEVLGRLSYELMPAEDVETARTRFATTIAAHQPLERMEDRFCHKKGHQVVLETSAVPILDGGRFLGYRGITRDVTARRATEESLRRRAAQMEALRQVATEITAQLDLDTLLHSIASRAVQLLGATGGGLYMYRPERDVLEWTIGVGGGQPAPGSVLSRGEGVSGCVWATGESLIVDDYRQWPGYSPAHDGLPNVAVLAVPVRWGEEFLGVLSVGREVPWSFSQADAELLTLFATDAAIAIRNARLYQAARRRTEHLAVLNRVATAVGETLGLDTLLERVYSEITSLFEADSFFIALYDPESGELDFRLQVDEGIRLPPERQPAGVGLTSRVIATGRPLLIRDLDQERATLPEPQLWGTMKLSSSWLGVPMRIGERLVGVICVQSYTPRAYDEEDQQLLCTIADQVAVAVERARLYQTMHESEEKYRALFEQANDAVLLIGADGVIVEANRRACELLGYDRAELVQQRADSFLPPEQARRYPHGPEVGPVRDMHVETRFLRRDGRRVEVEVSATRLEVGDRPLVLAVIRDITERRAAEAALRESEIKHRLLLNSIRFPVLALDGSMNILYCNEAYSEFIGIPRAELDGKNLLEVAPVFQEAESYTAMLEVLRTGQPANVEGKVGQRFLRSWIYPTPWGILAVAEDTTERRQLEEQLRQTQKMEAIGTLAGGIAHDFNNLLTGIVGYASLVQQAHPPDSQVYADMQAVLEAANRAADLTRQLLAVARMGPQGAKQPCDLNGIVREVCKLLERTIDKAITIELGLAGDLRPVQGDASQLYQMLLNLCLNARDAMPEGGRLCIETGQEFVEAEAAAALGIEPGEYVFLSVSDTGVGIAPALRERIFEPFFTTKDQGRGLGLAIVYGIVRTHDGGIRVSSRLGQGSTFQVYLPVHARAPELSTPEGTEVPGGSETVLVVDDEESVRSVLQRILERGGYQVILAKDGREAVEIFRQRAAEIDLVILDMVMPRMGGKQTYDRLRQLRAEVKVLLSSGYSEQGQAAEVLADGGRGFLQKPYDLRTVLLKVRQALDTP